MLGLKLNHVSKRGPWLHCFCLLRVFGITTDKTERYILSYIQELCFIYILTCNVVPIFNFYMINNDDF